MSWRVRREEIEKMCLMSKGKEVKQMEEGIKYYELVVREFEDTLQK